MTLQPSIATTRLRLRPPSLEDLDAIVSLVGAREVAATTMRIPHPYTRADGERFVELAAECRAQGTAWHELIEHLDDAALVGGVGLDVDREHKSGELGYWVGAPYWGRGYATEAGRAILEFGFEFLSLDRIHAHHFAGNPASGRVLEKIGMQREGILRSHVVKWGERRDLVCYGMLRTDFLEAR